MDYQLKRKTKKQNKKKHLRENENLEDICGSYCVSDTKTHIHPVKTRALRGTLLGCDDRWGQPHERARQ